MTTKKMTVEEKVEAIEKAKQLVKEAMKLVDVAVEDKCKIEMNNKAHHLYDLYNLYGSLLNYCKEGVKEEKA